LSFQDGNLISEPLNFSIVRVLGVVLRRFAFRHGELLQVLKSCYGIKEVGMIFVCAKPSVSHLVKAAC
jgi:hypothetical protein